jgi:hypothetical protein
MFFADQIHICTKKICFSVNFAHVFMSYFCVISPGIPPAPAFVLGDRRGAPLFMHRPTTGMTIYNLLYVRLSLSYLQCSCVFLYQTSINVYLDVYRRIWCWVT